MCRTVPLSIIRSSFTVHSAMVYMSVDSFRAWSICSCSKAVYKPVWHTQLLSVQCLNSWWWTKKLSETCRVSCQNNFVKLVHLVGFIIEKFVTMHGHTNVKFTPNIYKYNSSVSLRLLRLHYRSKICRGNLNFDIRINFLLLLLVRRMAQISSPTSHPIGKVNESEANSSKGFRISYSVKVNPQFHLDTLAFLSG